MTSSGKKRGLAVLATGALALSGLAFMTPAVADNIQQNEDNVVELYSQTSGDIGIRNDGKNTTVTLAAGSSSAATNSFVFWYSLDSSSATKGDDVQIADVASIQGFATYEWTPPNDPTLSDINRIYVEAQDNADNVLATSPATGEISTAGVPTNEVVSLEGSGTAARTPLGSWTNSPGSADDATVILSGIATQPGSTSLEIAGPQDDALSGTADVTGPAGPNGTPVGEVVNVNAGGGANNTNLNNGPDEVIGRAFNTGDSDAVQAYELYEQTITTVTTTTIDGLDPNVIQGGGNDLTRYEIKVTDQTGAPIGGVDMFEATPIGGNLGNGCGGNQGAAYFSDGGPSFDDGETGPTGTIELELEEIDIDDPVCDDDQDGNFSNESHNTFVVVDHNEDGDFDNGLDDLIELVQFRAVQVPATIELSSSLGDVMDADELTNITALVKDAGGNTIEDATVTLKLDRDVADNSPVDSTTVCPTDDTNAAGIADFTCAALGGALQQPGVNGNEVAALFTATTGAVSDTLAIETDEADVVWDSGEIAQALANTDTTEGGVVQLPSGSKLPNRHVEINLTHPGGGNSLFSPQVEQPAGTIRGGDTIADATTDASGHFAVKIDDPAAPVGEELDNNLNAEFDDGGLGDTPDADLNLDWLRSLTPARVEILNGPGGVNGTPLTPTTADGIEPLLTQNPLTLNPGQDPLIPGGLGVGQVRVFNSDDTPLDNISVNLTLDEGNFVDLADPFEPTPAIGAPIDFASVGQNVTVTTGDLTSLGAGLDEGSALIIVNMERNAGFDDDGLVSDELQATAGSASDEHDLTWTTRTVPLNPRATDPLVVELSADQESSILPKARAGNTAGVGQEVDYDVSTWDQFGNPTRQNIDVDDSNPISDFSGGVQSDFALFQPAISANSPAATNQSLEVELEGPVTFTYFDDVNDSSFDPADPLDNIQSLPVVVEENTAAINWYNVNYDASTFTLVQQGPNTVPVGTAVTEVLSATDQEGQPLENLRVDFLRGGPGSDDDDSCFEDDLNNCQATDGNGEAFYDFVGGSIGTATVSAVVYEPVVDGGTRIDTIGPDTVRFGSLATINVKLSGKNAKNGKDRLKVNAPSIAGQANVRLQKKVNGQWKQVGATKVLNAFGNKVFRVKDKNGSAVTKYRVKVSPTTTTKKDTSNKVKQK